MHGRPEEPLVGSNINSDARKRKGDILAWYWNFALGTKAIEVQGPTCQALHPKPYFASADVIRMAEFVTPRSDMWCNSVGYDLVRIVKTTPFGSGQQS